MEITQEEERDIRIGRFEWVVASREEENDSSLYVFDRYTFSLMKSCLEAKFDVCPQIHENKDTINGVEIENTIIPIHSLDGTINHAYQTRINHAYQVKGCKVEILDGDNCGYLLIDEPDSRKRAEALKVLDEVFA